MNVAMVRIRALLGHGEAMWQLGKRCTADGDATEQRCTYEAAFKWFSDAAARGYAPAMACVGDCDFHGEGVAQDHAAALQWYRC